ncbi:hypothetical protein LX32DRAFT_719922 [Colletotrichum zoysiae]|uniref:Uncharacterized protein n=1 Tax=Colletotrichum zoysiae TaxID=1216348 RepID=A0AAD9LZU7_9PEZI|nr:hypothetical protein LX32DRAFT_719922 [Colletotrichum zoysiae]
MRSLIITLLALWLLPAVTLALPVPVCQDVRARKLSPTFKKEHLVIRDIETGEYDEEEGKRLRADSEAYPKKKSDLIHITQVVRRVLGKDTPWALFGGFAFVLYGEPNRHTADLDVVVQTSLPNLIKLLKKDPNFIIPSEEMYTKSRNMRTYYKWKNEIFQVDFNIPGISKVWKAQDIRDIIQETYVQTSDQKSALVYLIRLDVTFKSKCRTLTDLNRMKDTDMQDISWIIKNHPDAVAAAKDMIPIEWRRLVISRLNRMGSPLVGKAEQLLGLDEEAETSDSSRSS